MTFEVRVPFGSNSFGLKQGETIALDFPDGKGVRGKIAGYSTAEGGTPFSIICTEDGTYSESKPDEPHVCEGSPEAEVMKSSINALIRSNRRLRDSNRELHRDKIDLEQQLQAAEDRAQLWESQARNWEQRYNTLSDMTAVTQPGVVTGETIRTSEDGPVIARETFQVESPRSRVRVSYGRDGAVVIEITEGEAQ